MGKMIVLKLGDRKYGMMKMPPIKGATFGIKIAKLVSKVLTEPGAAVAMKMLKDKFGNSNRTEENLSTEEAMNLGGGILALFGGVDDKEFSAILKEAFSYEVWYEDTRLSDEDDFNNHFAQYPGDLYIVGCWAAYNHVKDFFSGLGDGLKAFGLSSKKDQLPQ